MKAYFIFKGVKITRTHSIDFLLIECGKFDMTFNEIDVKNIDDFADLIRYPDNQIVPEISETRFFFKIAKENKEKVEKEIFLSPGF